jgi:Chitobiase/beta-hexosaminidase C-terminal domain/FG-GAP-like repeat/Bacterial Ig-like domain (group 3)
MNLPWVAAPCPKQRVSILQSENWARALRYLSLMAAVSATCQSVCAAALPPTTTTLAVTSGTGAVTTVPAGSVVALTATVNAGSTAVTAGQVNFCDASASNCTDIHLLGTSQLTAGGTAILRFRPGIGNHSYKAVFAGTNNDAGSSSSVSALSVTGATGTLATTTTIAETGSWGNYALTATVTESGGTLPPTGAVSFLDTSNGNVALATPTLGAAVPGVDWPNPQQLITGSVSEAVAIGDFNGDGIPDLAVSPGTPQQPLAILLGNANGSYTTAPALSFYAYSLGPIVVADFNGDGKQDLAALTVYSNTVTVLLGNGDGTFNLVASSPAIASSSQKIAVGDFNGDGIPDLVVTDDLSSSLKVFLGNGDGTFTATPAGPVASGSPNAVAVGDFNQDGKLDLAVSDTYADTISILLGNGDGTFPASTSLHSGSGDSPLAAADFNLDGKLDLVVGIAGAGGVNDSVIILAGNGDGTFTAPPSGQAVSSTSIGSINVGDFNGDGIPDLALTDNVSGALTTFLASGSGSFIPFSTILPSSPYHELFCAVGDLNGDGRSDLVIGDQDGAAFKDYLTEPTETATATANLSLTGVGQHPVDGSYSGDSNYTPSLSSTLPLWGVQPVTATTLSVSSGGSPATSVAPGTVVALTATVAAGASPVTAGQVDFCDASATECTDIHLLATVTLASNGTATFQFVPGAGTHSYKAVFVEDGFGRSSASAPSTLTVGPAKNPIYTDTTAITEGGLPGGYSLTATVVGYGGTAAPTGNTSFLDTSFGNTSLATATLGPATAGFGWLLSQTPAVSNSIASQVTGDFNGDGIPDLALFSVTYSVAGSFTIFFGKGDGTFTAGPTTQTTIAYGINYSMVAEDLNGDGKTDLAILSYSQAENVTTFLGNGDGTFAAPANVAINQPSQGGDGVPGSLIAADFNGDGKIDLAAAGDYIAQGGANILLGNGDGTFTPTGTSLQFPLDFNLIATGDFNGDGIPDLVATQYFDPGGAYIFLGKGDGTFTAAATTIATTRFVTSIVVGDFNQDGKPDLAFGYSSGLQGFLGNGDGTFTQATGSPLNGAGGSLTSGDFNHDGKLDLAGVDNYNNLIDLFLGVGDGTFTPASTTPVVSQATPFSIVAADFNEDGVPDLAMLTTNQLTASILLAEPTETASATVNGIAPVGAGTHNVLASYAGDPNYSPTVSTTIPLTAGLPPVTMSPAAGTYSSAQTVTLTETVPGATIYYLLTGTVNTNGFVPYTGPISLAVGGQELLQAYATETGYQTSSYAAAMYYLNLPALPPPVLSPAAGSYAAAQTVTIADSVAGATIYYTTNGSLPTPSSAKYTGAITVNSSETISAIAVDGGHAVSARVTAQYLIGTSRSSFIYTIAGDGSTGYSGDGGQATTAQLNAPYASALDAAGNLYFADSQNNVVRKVAAGTGVITTVAGVGTYGYSGDNGPATNAQLGDPTGLAIDKAGNLYFADSGNSVVRKVASNGVITTIAGNGTAGSSGDGGPATSAEMYFPAGVAVDNAGNLYIADYSYSVIREVSAKTGVITTVAGNGQPGYSGDGGAATAAQLYLPFGVTTDSSGNLYIADTFNNVIRKVNATNAVISTVAGNGYGAGVNGSGGYTGDGGAATSAELNQPFGVAVDSAGNLYIADANNLVIRVVAAASGIISTVAGDGSACTSAGGDGGPATSAGFCYPAGVTADGAGNLYVADGRTPRIRQVRVSSLPPTAQTAAPTFSIPPGTYAGPQTVTVADSTPGAAIYVSLDGSAPKTAGIGYLGPITVSGGMTIEAIAVAPGFMASAPATTSYTITSEPTAVITTVAGDGVSGFSSGGGSPGNAQLGSLAGVAVDHSGNLFFADATNDVVWELTAKTGLLSIVAGLGQPSIGDNSGLGASVQFNGPAGVAVDGTGNLFIADTGDNVVWKVAAGTGLIQIYAGQEFSPLGTNLGDGGPATSASLVEPSGLAVDSAGNLYISESGEGLVRFVSASTGVITSVAGVGPAVDGSNADGIPATSANLPSPGALALDGNGNLYIAQPFYGRVRKVTLSTGLITTVAGNGDSFGSSGDGGPALKAEVFPQGLAIDSAGNLYLSDPAEIRKISAATGIISNFAGNRYFGHSGDGGSATVAEVANPQGITFDASGDLYIADQVNYRVREVFSSAHAFVTPGITVTPSATSITTAQPLTVVVAVNGGAGKSTPTGSVTLTSGGYSVEQNLANGTTTFNLAPGSLPVGANTLTATYAPDDASAGTYSVASQNATVTVANPMGAAVATVTLTPSASTITNQQAITVGASVAGGTGQATPTGSVTLASGSYSSQQPLANGGASFSIPAGVLTATTNTLTANYSGDVNYAAASGTTTVTVVPLVVTVPATPAVAPGSAATVTATFSAGSTYSGTLNLTCALTASPAHAQSVPTCSLNPASVVVATGGKATTVVTVNTTAASSGNALNRWGGGGILALALLFVTPTLRRRKTTLLLIACGIAIIGCGGGGTASSGPPPTTTPATTPGSYTFLVTATDASNAKVTASANLTVTVE